MGRVRDAIFKARKKNARKPLSFARVTRSGASGMMDRYFRAVGGIRMEAVGRQTLEMVSEKDLLTLDINDLAIKMVKNDSLTDLAVDSFTTLTTLEHSITAGSDRGQREVDAILQLLEEKKAPLSLHVSHIASSLIVRGNACIETEFDEAGNPLNLWVIDPRWFEWRLTDKQWQLGQYETASEWKPIESPNVVWLAVNPLVGERTGRSPIQTSFTSSLDDAALIGNLSKIVRTQAGVRRYIQFKVLEMKKAEFTDDEIDAEIAQAQKDMDQWANLKPEDVPTSTDNIQWNEVQGESGAGNFRWADTLDRVYDRKGLRGTKLPPFVANSNEFVAESSAETQSKFYSVRLGAGTELLTEGIEWAFRRFLRARGVSDDPVFTTKRVNAVERLEESRAFEAAMKAIGAAVEAGIALDIAIDLFEGETGHTISAEVKQAIAARLEAYPEPEPEPDEE